MPLDFSKMSDEDLQAFVMSPAIEAGKTLEESEVAKRKARGDTSMGMSNSELFFAGAGKAFMDPVQGTKELGRVAFGPKGESGPIQDEHDDYQRMGDDLLNNWSAKAGNVLGKGVMSLAAPARMGPQAALAILQESLSPSRGGVGSTGKLLLNRAVNGAEGALGTLVPGYALKGLGRTIGAATQRYTPEGKEALRLNDAANRLGIRRNVGSLDPSSNLNAFETSLPGYSRVVEDQVGKFKEAARDTVPIPSKTGKSTTDKVIEGEKVRQAVTEAGDNLNQQGRSLWNDLDAYVVQNNLNPVDPTLSSVRVKDIASRYAPSPRRNQAPDPMKNEIFKRVGDYDPEAAKMLVWMSQNNPKSYAVPFSDLHTMQSAVGKALSRAKRDASAPGASRLDRDSLTELKNLYGSLMTDVDNWGTTNPGAKKMYDEAKAFWRERVVPGTINNKVFGKSSKGTFGSDPRGYSEAHTLYGDILNNPRAVGELQDWMSPGGRDLIDTLTTMPDVSKALIGNVDHPKASGMGTLTTLSGMLVGSPLQFGKAALSHLPGFRRVMTSDPAKKLYFSRDVLRNTPAGKAGWALAQDPKQRVVDELEFLRNGETE